MQLFEVKNDIAKIIYNPTENHLLPSDFLLFEDVNQKLIAQIVNISTTENSSNNIADVRLSLSIDKDDNLSFYNGYIPAKSSNIVYINPDEIIELIKGSRENIYLGNLINHSDCFVKPPLSFIDERLYIQSDREDKTKTVVQNIISELYSKQKKVILLDFDGRYNSIMNVPRLKISESFKLPLNIDAFSNILEYDTADCPIEDKAVIQSIVLELREYIKTVENKFLPFTLFKNVVDNEFMANPISGLMLLRNKLWLYAQESIFAESKSQFDIVNNIIEKQNLLVIDASSLEEKWYKFAIQTIISLVYTNCYFVLSLNDVPMDKKAILSLYNKSNIIPVVSTSYDSKYRSVLKSICKNHILFKPSKPAVDEENYAPFLLKMNSGEFILFGESTLYLPLLIELQPFDSSTSEEVIQNEIKKDVDKLLSSPKKIIPETTIVSEDIPRPMSVNTDENVQSVEEEIIDNDFNDSDLDFLDEQNQEQLTIDDIRSKKQRESVKESQYDVFAPLKSDADGVGVDEIPAKNIDENISLTADADIDFLDELPSIDILEEQPASEIQNEKPVNTQTDDNAEDIDSILADILPMGVQEYASNAQPMQETKEKETAVSASVQENEAADILDGLDSIEPLQGLADEQEQKDDKNEKESETLTVQTPIKEQKELNENSLAALEDENSVLDDVINDITSKMNDSASVNSTNDRGGKAEEVYNTDNTNNTAYVNKTSITNNIDVLKNASVVSDINTDTADNTGNTENAEDKQNTEYGTEDAGQTENTAGSSEDDFVVELETDDEDNGIQPPSSNVNISAKKSPDLTVYETDVSNGSISNEMPFQIGDKVYHPKHGNGVIEGFANYSNKILFCQIEFENVGRRILDPRISGLEKIS